MTWPVFKQMTNLSGLRREIAALASAHNLDPGPIRGHFESRAASPNNLCSAIPGARRKLSGQSSLTDSGPSGYRIKPTLPGKRFFKREVEIVNLFCATHQPCAARTGVLRRQIVSVHNFPHNIPPTSKWPLSFLATAPNLSVYEYEFQ